MALNKQTIAPKSYEDKCNWLRLMRSENVSDAGFWQLLRRYGSPAAALEALPLLAAKGGSKDKINIAKREDIERELEESERHNVEYLFAGQSEYPELLYQMPCSPPVLSLYGNAKQLARPGVSLVGSRRATTSGLQLAAHFGEDIGKAGFSVISGFAAGIDTAAHQASLTTGTIAVLAGGIGHIYPSENTRLYHEIIDHGGLIISEHGYSHVARSSDFPRRNRIVAGLSLAMVVIEASLRSGTLISARLAGQYNRLVFAIPQNLLQPQAQGNNKLLKAGAMVAVSPRDVIESLMPIAQPASGQLCLLEPAAAELTPPEPPVTNKEADPELVERILSILTYNGANIKTLAFLTQSSCAQVENALLSLELAGKILRHHDGRPLRRVAS